jgi:uncharacterized protein YwgA
MKEYWLAKLISSVDCVDSRKRLQKAIYLLQQLVDCPLRCDYILHYYGPYSFELAGLMDKLSGSGIINEEPEPTGFGYRYKSSIKQEGKEMLEKFEARPEGQEVKRQISPFIEKFKELNGKNPWVLELAATIAFFYTGDWSKAKNQTMEFKKLSQSDHSLEEALDLARTFKN